MIFLPLDLLLKGFRERSKKKEAFAFSTIWSLRWCIFLRYFVNCEPLFFDMSCRPTWSRDFFFWPQKSLLLVEFGFSTSLQ